jgi:hypothetical protein
MIPSAQALSTEIFDFADPQSLPAIFQSRFSAINPGSPDRFTN